MNIVEHVSLLPVGTSSGYMPRRGMDTENVVHLHNGILLSYLKNEFMKFLGKWMDLKGIILSEVTQSQRNSHNMYSLISGY